MTGATIHTQLASFMYSFATLFLAALLSATPGRSTNTAPEDNTGEGHRIATFLINGQNADGRSVLEFAGMLFVLEIEVDAGSNPGVEIVGSLGRVSESMYLRIMA